MISGVARVSMPRDKTIFAPPTTKIAEFEVKKAEEAKALHLLFVTSIFFSKYTLQQMNDVG